MTTKRAYIFGGGTFSHVRSHLALAAPAFGTAARQLDALFWKAARRSNKSREDKIVPHLILTKMADPASNIVTNVDLERAVDEVVANEETRIIFMSAAVADYDGRIDDVRSGKTAERLRTSGGGQVMNLTPTPKILPRIRKARKDIFLVGFKTTSGATPDEQYLAGLDLLKRSSCNLVLANDLRTRLNMVITPEQARYHETTNRDEALRGLVDMTLLRERARFTRSTVVPGNPVPWGSDLVPSSLRAVVNHCIGRGAYKPFNGSTVGHFAVKVGDNEFLTSRRKTDFNRLGEVGLVRIVSSGDDSVIAYGSKPSVGGQSQRIIFNAHPDVDCIVHFHCPLKPGSEGIPVRPQRAHECGSHECGRNTSEGLRRFGDVCAVMLDQHGPNIVFNRNVDPQVVIDFIEAHFDLAGRTDGVDATVARAYAQGRPNIEIAAG